MKTLKTYLITIQAVVVTDDPPVEHLIDMQVGQDYPTITSTKVVEMVPKEPEPQPKPQPVISQTTLALAPATPRATLKISKGRPSRERSSLLGGRGPTEFFFSSQGYTAAARRLGVGTLEGEPPMWGVWLTKEERKLVKTDHLGRLQKSRELKQAAEGKEENAWISHYAGTMPGPR